MGLQRHHRALPHCVARLVLKVCIVDAHRGDGQPFIVRADEKLTVFVEKSPSQRCYAPAARPFGELSFCRNLFYLVVGSRKFSSGWRWSESQRADRKAAGWRSLRSLRSTPSSRILWA